jgi:hypothetical protein
MPENKTQHYSQQSFRPEAVEAFATRQAGEPWDAKARYENWIAAGLTLLIAVALVCVFAGAR